MVHHSDCHQELLSSGSGCVTSGKLLILPEPGSYLVSGDTDHGWILVQGKGEVKQLGPGVSSLCHV